MTHAAQHPVAYPLWVIVRVLILGCVLGCVLGCAGLYAGLCGTVRWDKAVRWANAQKEVKDLAAKSLVRRHSFRNVFNYKRII